MQHKAEKRARLAPTPETVPGERTSAGRQPPRDSSTRRRGPAFPALRLLGHDTNHCEGSGRHGGTMPTALQKLVPSFLMGRPTANRGADPDHLKDHGSVKGSSPIGSAQSAPH